MAALTHNDDQPEELLTIAEVADLLKVSKRTVIREIDAGRLGHVRVRRAIRVRTSQYEEYVAGLTLNLH